MATEAPRPSKGGDQDASMGSLAGEFKDLVVAYAKQETLDPIKDLGRFVLFGVIGAVLIAFGSGVLVLAAVRAAQAESGHHLTGSLTWLPYVGGILVALIIAGLAALRIVRSPR